ncbi:MAG: hypothetical protein CMP81_15410 [Fulvimarina sp.]|nr:hypothetical protein [Fulvimarina sp.]
MNQTRKEIMAELVRMAKEATARGESAFAFLCNKGVPVSIAEEAEWEAGRGEEEAWWQRMERTIEGEVVRKAIGGDS